MYFGESLRLQRFIFIFLIRFLPTKRACGQVGHLKLCCPNVRRYKLLLVNYLQMFSWFPSAETKVQKNYQCSITSVSPTCHKPMLAVVLFVATLCLLVRCLKLFVKRYVGGNTFLSVNLCVCLSIVLNRWLNTRLIMTKIGKANHAVNANSRPFCPSVA